MAQITGSVQWLQMEFVQTEYKKKEWRAVSGPDHTDGLLNQLWETAHFYI